MIRWIKKGWVGPLHWRVKQKCPMVKAASKKNPLPNPWFSALLIIYCMWERNIGVFNQSQSYHRITMKWREFPTANPQDFAMYVCQVKPPSPLVRLNLGRVPISSFSPLGCSPKLWGSHFWPPARLSWWTTSWTSWKWWVYNYDTFQ